MKKKNANEKNKNEDDTSFDVDLFEQELAEEREQEERKVVTLGPDPTVDNVLELARRRLHYTPHKLERWRKALEYQPGETYGQRKKRLARFYNELWPPRPVKQRRDTE